MPMFFARPQLSDLLLAAAYFAAASLMLSLTRFDGGVAFLWLAGALLIPVLAGRPRREWGTPMALCGAASAIATGLVGLGWALALPLAMINLVEAYVGASLLVRYRATRAPLGSLPWLFNFVLSVGLVAPLVAGIFAASVISFTGRPPLSTFVHFFVGHALGNITFIPLVTLALIQGRLRGVLDVRQKRVRENLGLLTLVALTTALVFSQNSLPLLFLPMLPIILTTFRAKQSGAAVSIVLLALIGGAFTLMGKGPMNLIDGSIGSRVQFLQFYLAATVLTVLPVTADLRNRARLHKALRESELRYRLLADHSTDIILHLDMGGSVLYASPSIQQIGGYSPEDIVGRPVLSLVPDQSRPAVIAGHAATLAAGGRTHSYRHLANTRHGEARWYESHARIMLDDRGQPDGILSVVRDITLQVQAEERLAKAAMTDALTGLPNRRAFRAAAENLQAAPGGSRTDCIAIFDIDHFKRVNDRYGHDAGDAVLVHFGTVAREVLRQNDLLARLGGEEFAALLPATSIPQALEICERLRAEISVRFALVGEEAIRVTISGGVAQLGEAGLDEALRRADVALYEAKNGGRDQLALAA